MNKILLMGIAALVWTGCDKAGGLPESLNGSYRGQFISGPASSLDTSATELMVKGNTYSSTKGSGTFKLDAGKVVEFSDTNFWTADFDWNTILSGKYNYQVKGDSLILTKVYPDSIQYIQEQRYQYRLKRLR